jgi:multidrug efflux pump subunit AcrB
MKRTQAILQAGPVRLRPIMITTFSTILGMLPIALGFGAGYELRSPMAIAIAGGLVTSTILSLIVVPVVYAILDDWFPRKRMN